jgi:uncharacterized coiled-coil protein SlyX
MEISKAILALISIAINLRARAARLEELQAEQAATIAGMQAKVDAMAPQTIDVSADVADALTAAAGN